MAKAIQQAAGSRKHLEVHEHCFVSGQRARQTWNYKFSHSHEGGNVPHQHPDTGPAAYTIDKDEWARTTGLVGGGRKRYTTRPTGEQLPRVELEESQRTFDVFIVGDPPEPREVNGRLIQETGPGIALPTRIASTFGMTARVHDLRRKQP